jgi:hypothetical protein
MPVYFLPRRVRMTEILECQKYINLINYSIRILNIKICSTSRHSLQSLVVFVLCEGCIQTSIAISYHLKRCRPYTAWYHALCTAYLYYNNAVVFWHSEDRASWYFLIIKPTRCANFSNQRDAPISQIYFWNRTLHVSDSFSVHHQESSTVHTATRICHTGYADCLLAGSSWSH